MAPCNRAARAGVGRFLSASGRSLATLVLAATGFAGMSGAALGPATGTVADYLTAELKPALSFSGEDITITGSVAALFQGGVFTGPNVLAKQDRVRPLPDALAISGSFEEIRRQLAAERAQVAAAEGAKQKIGDSLIALAPTGAPLQSSALGAIEAALPGSPAPFEMPASLAYARANTPSTVVKSPHRSTETAKQLNCLATAIYFEARGESYRGQVAVAQVVLNRVKHPAYPTTICSVVFQNQHKRNACQFSFACDGIPERVTEARAWQQAEEIAKKVTEGELYLTDVANATHYHANYVNPKWAPRLTRLSQIGLHIFYRFKTG